MNEKLRRIIDHYGVTKQLKYFQSEVFELNEAIIKELNTGCIETIADSLCKIFAPPLGQEHEDRKDHIKEEIADVMVMLKQFQLFYDIPTTEIKDIMNFKINRTIDRIKEESEDVK